MGRWTPGRPRGRGVERRRPLGSKAWLTEDAKGKQEELPIREGFQIPSHDGAGVPPALDQRCTHQEEAANDG